MVKGLKPKRVARDVGRNPVAQAVARSILKQAVLDQKIQLYLLAEDAPCVDALVPIVMLFTAFIASAGRDDTREVRILKGAVSACEQMITNNSYRKTNTTTLDVALDCAVELSRQVDPVLFNRAWNELSGGAP
jgi:hypothetical protein